MEVGPNTKKKLSDRVSPEAWSTNSDSPTPTTSVIDRHWGKDIVWEGALGDEHRLLLATEEESSDRHSSDEDTFTYIESIYNTSSEQYEYYKKQFYTLQPNDNGLISGKSAKMFFEKSCVPIGELRHIWQLCDVTKDGALSLPEFVAAMHLIVLRRNNIPLPHMLPPCLNPYKITYSDQYEKTSATKTNCLRLDECKMRSNDDNDSIEQFENSFSTIKIDLNSPLQFEMLNSNDNEIEVIKTSQSQPSSLKKSCTGSQETQWTKFPESPTAIMPSLGLKPVHFDLKKTAQAVVSDPQILHPVALRVTPVDTMQPNENHIHNSHTIICPDVPQTKDILAETPKACEYTVGSMHCKVKAANNSDLYCKALPLPPKTYRHSRSSSLDLSKLKYCHVGSFEEVKNTCVMKDCFKTSSRRAATVIYLCWQHQSQ